MSRGKVAIYMCCYNHEKFVAEAIESVINQTYTNWELWIANDGSTDASAEIISSYKDERIHFFNFKENTRLVGAQSFLLDRIRCSECEYIVGTASDDKWKSNRLEKQVDVLLNHPQYGACFSWDEMIFENEANDDVYSGMKDYSHEKNRSRNAWLLRLLLFTNCINACSAMVRTEIFFEVEGYNQFFIRLGDYRLWLRIMQKYPIYMVEEPLVYYRRHGNNLSKPSINGSIALWNEDLFIRRDIYKKMSPRDFFKTFYYGLIYEINTQVDYCVDKIFFFVSLAPKKRVIYGQLAIEQWLEYSDDQQVMNELKDKYGLTNSFLEYMNGRSGITVTLAEHVVGFEESLEFKGPSFEEYFVNQFSRNGLTRTMICNPFYRIALYLISINSYSEIFEHMKKNVYEMRSSILCKKGDKEKTLHIICENGHKDDIDNIIDEYKNEYRIIVSYVRKTQDYILMNKEESYNVKNAEYVELFDFNDYGLCFGKDVGIHADVIYYIDCLGDDYECTDMVRGYNIGITQMAIIDRKKFSDESVMKALEVTIGAVEYI